jgi:hypothetical protein
MDFLIIIYIRWVVANINPALAAKPSALHTGMDCEHNSHAVLK